MSSISRQQGKTITGVMGVLFGCAGVLTCVSTVFNIIPFIQSMQYGGSLNAIATVVALVANFCLALGLVALPVVFYYLLVANNPESPAAPAESPADKDRPVT